ncbi:MAG: hypothetical protein KIT87_11980 [Anaerolineae bacterium]|nr:hypothetical protein [Anaerolineae bacterium]
MWVLAQYQIVSLFSLKVSAATGSGAKSLLVPTPYAIKMALLDAACRTLGSARAETMWPAIRDAQVAFNPSPSIVVTNLFAKFWRPWEFKGKAEDKLAAVAEARSEGKYPFQATIAFREYVQHAGPLGIAFEVTHASQDVFTTLLLQVNYLGKRGGFVQLHTMPRQVDELPDDYLIVNAPPAHFSLNGIVQMLDDCGPALLIQSSECLQQGADNGRKERIIRHVVLPYRLTRSSKSFSLYERVD